MLLLKLISLFLFFSHVTSAHLDCDFWCKNGMNAPGSSCECSTSVEPENTYKAVIDQDSAIYYEPTDDTALPTLEKSFYIPNPVHKVYKKDNFRSSPVNYPAFHRVSKSISDVDNGQSKENNDEDENNDSYLDIDLVKDLGRANDVKHHYDLVKMQINLMDCLSIRSYLKGEEQEIPSYVNIPTTIDINSKEGKELLKAKCKYVDNIFASALQDVYDSYPRKSKSIPETPAQFKFEYLQTTTDNYIDLHDKISSETFESTEETNKNDDEEVGTDLFTAPSTQVENTVKLNQIYDSTTVISPLLDDTTVTLLQGKNSHVFVDNDVLTSQSVDQELENIEDDIKTLKPDLEYNVSNYENYHNDHILNSSVISDISSGVHLNGDSTAISTENISVSKTPELYTENDTLYAISTSATLAPSLENETENNSSGKTFCIRSDNNSTSDTPIISDKISTDAIPTTNLSPFIVEKETGLHSVTEYYTDEPTLKLNNSADDSSKLTNVSDTNTMAGVTLVKTESEDTDQIIEEGKTGLNESIDQTGQEINVIDLILEMQKSNKKPIWKSNEEEKSESNQEEVHINSNQTINDTETTSFNKENGIKNNEFDFYNAILEDRLNKSKADQDEVKGFIYLMLNNKQFPVRFIQGSNGELRIAINGTSLCQQLFDFN